MNALRRIITVFFATVLSIFTIISVYADYKADFSIHISFRRGKRARGRYFKEAFERISDFLSAHNMKGDLKALRAVCIT
jgi:hypothetical protein